MITALVLLGYAAGVAWCAPALLTPLGPHPFGFFSAEHFCATWQPLLTFNNGNEPQQP